MFFGLSAPVFPVESETVDANFFLSFLSTVPVDFTLYPYGLQNVCGRFFKKAAVFRFSIVFDQKTPFPPPGTASE
ncbi:hypothetical protein [Pseudodesulfovibrio profundus]|jgi:hypothetical protein|uniref:hypothetical protein n=1 Tax=Pseudodesulfovibrio profundus TaxID=57320 RepID=UPI000BE4684F|nr:hypothetical protein [Pseudodesulfovibrio profundus]